MIKVHLIYSGRVFDVYLTYKILLIDLQEEWHINALSLSCNGVDIRQQDQLVHGLSINTLSLKIHSIIL